MLRFDDIPLDVRYPGTFTSNGKAFYVKQASGVNEGQCFLDFTFTTFSKCQSKEGP